MLRITEDLTEADWAGLLVPHKYMGALPVPFYPVFQLVDYAVNDVVVRVAGRLVELCDRYGAEDGAGIDVGLAITQDELASWAGASREAVAKGMALLRTLGWVRTERRRIIVLDLPALRRYSA